jgi:hypothetical protein
MTETQPRASEGSPLPPDHETLSRQEFQHLDPSAVEPLIEEERSALRRDARVSAFIDILAERRVRERLSRAMAIGDAERPSDGTIG